MSVDGCVDPFGCCRVVPTCNGPWDAMDGRVLVHLAPPVPSDQSRWMK